MQERHPTNRTEDNTVGVRCPNPCESDNPAWINLNREVDPANTGFFRPIQKNTGLKPLVLLKVLGLVSLFCP